MKTKLLLALAFLGCAAAGPVSPKVTPIASTATAVKDKTSQTKITGDYVEARTAAVFAGACHYNGELVTTGNDAVMAWSFASGNWHGTDLSGVKAMAAVSSQANLGDNKARQCDLLVDRSATDAQLSALKDLLASKCGTQLGKIVSVRRGLVSFDRDGKAYHVTSPGFASMNVQPMPDDACCTQPNLVWYSPLVSLNHRKVGYTEKAGYAAGTVGDAWQQSGENSAFYGAFTF